MPIGGAPTQDEIQAQWRAFVDIIDQAQTFADGLAGAGQEFDTLVQSFEGDYAPEGLANWAVRMRSGLSVTIDPGFAFDALTPILFEYAKFLASVNALGSGFTNVSGIKDALYKHFIDTGETVETRAIVLDVTPTVVGTGNGTISRLITDEENFQREGVHVERKVFACVQDQNSGVRELAERFTMLGQAASGDNLEFNAFGSGISERKSLVNNNAGSGANGSTLRNSSFSDFDASATNRFTDWELVSGTNPTQDTTNFYLTHPNATTDASLTAAADFRLKQSLLDMRVTKLKQDKPYFLRVMLNKTIGTALGGTVNLSLGSQSVSVTIAAMSANWTELLIPLDQNSWFTNFNQDDFNVEIEWTGRTSGTLNFDDMIFVEMTEIDGTFWVLRQNSATPVSWLVRDEVQFTDTQADNKAGKVQFWLFRAGLGYLPHTTAANPPTFPDP